MKPSQTTLKRRMNPIKILIDTREQIPLNFSRFRDYGIVFERSTLDFGDYSIEGYERSFIVERKSLDDLVNTLIYDYESDRSKPGRRFNRELDILSRADFCSLMVTANMTDIDAHHYHSLASPKSVWGLITSMMFRYGVAPCFAGSETYAADIIARWAMHYPSSWRKLTEKDSHRASEIDLGEF